MYDYLVEHTQILTSVISPSLSIKRKAFSLPSLQTSQSFQYISSLRRRRGRRGRRRRRRMCSLDLISFNGCPSSFPPKTCLKKAKAHRLRNSRVRRPCTGRRKRLKKRCRLWKEEMKMVNKKLYFENKWIMEENKRLRERAVLLSQEKKVLLSHLHTA